MTFVAKLPVNVPREHSMIFRQDANQLEAQRDLPREDQHERFSDSLFALQRKVGDTEQSLRRNSDRETKEPKGPPWVRFGAPLSTLTRLADGLGLKELALPASRAGFAPILGLRFPRSSLRKIQRLRLSLTQSTA